MKKIAPATLHPYFGERLPPEEIERIWTDEKELLRWTIEQLEGDAPDAERHSPYLMFCALVQKDLEGLERMLAEHPEHAPMAILIYAKRTFLPKRGRGRPKRKVTAASFIRNTNRWFAATDVKLIGMIWKQRLGKMRNRTDYPTCFDVAAKRRGLRPNEVETYFTKNQYRYRRQNP